MGGVDVADELRKRCGNSKHVLLRVPVRDTGREEGKVIVPVVEGGVGVEVLLPALREGPILDKLGQAGRYLAGGCEVSQRLDLFGGPRNGGLDRGSLCGVVPDIRNQLSQGIGRLGVSLLPHRHGGLCGVGDKSGEGRAFPLQQVFGVDVGHRGIAECRPEDQALHVKLRLSRVLDHRGEAVALESEFLGVADQSGEHIAGFLAGERDR